MNSYVTVTCLAWRVSEEYGIAKSQTRYAARPSLRHPPSLGTPILYILVSRPKSFWCCSFWKTCYSKLYRNIKSVFFIFIRSRLCQTLRSQLVVLVNIIGKYKCSELNKILSIRIRFLLNSHLITLWWTWSIFTNVNLSRTAPKIHPFAKTTKKKE